MLEILSVVGTRPNFVKVAPIARVLAGDDAFRHRLIHTGQHYEANLSGDFFEDLEIPRPEIDLGIGSGRHGWQTGRTLEAIETLLFEQKPDCLLVYGDVNSTLAAALAAAKLHIPVAHVEAGLRSGDRTMPEEINRLLVDQLSDLLFTHSPEAEGNLKAEGRPEKSIHFVGNVMIDSLMRWSSHAGERRAWEAFDLSEGNYGLVTLHRPRNVDSPERLREILAVLEEVSERQPLLYPIHPRTRDRLTTMGLSPGSDRLRLIEPRRYLDFLSLQKGARFVLTDSGGVQEETTCWGVPCLTVRPNTERPITIEQGTNRLVEPQAVPAAVDEILASNPPEGQIPALWDGRAAERIVEVLRQHDFAGPSKARAR